MAYDTYPAVDDTYQFPPEIRAAIAQSVELLAAIAALSAPISADFVGGRALKAGELVLHAGTIYRRKVNGSPATFVTGEYDVVGTDASDFDARIDVLESQSVTVSELETGRTFPTITGTSTFYILAANLVQRIGACTLVSATTIAQSGVNYWTVTLQRGRAGVWSDIWSRTTQAADGSALAAGIPWNADLRVWSAISRYLNKGDILRLVFTATGAPDPWTTPCISWRYEPGVVPSTAITGTDTFDRADSAVSPGIADSGQTWLVAGGTAGISGGKLYAVTGGDVKVYSNWGFYDGKITSTFTVAGASSQFIVRYTDANNYVFLDSSYNLYKVVGGGSSILIGSFGGAAKINTDQVEFSFFNNQYALKINGVSRGGVLTDAGNSFLTVMNHGYRFNGSTASRAEDWIAQAAV